MRQPKRSSRGGLHRPHTLQASLGEGAAGAGFQVAFEGECTPAIGESDTGFDSPRAVLSSMGTFTSVVYSQTLPKILGMTSIEVI